jgi:hypothetical protein
MKLNSFTVHGFRSIEHVEGIPVNSPTVVTGHNDGGKSATLSALGFLLGTYGIAEDDPTFLPGAAATDSVPPREQSTWVEGNFLLSDWETEHFGIPKAIRIRRTKDLGQPDRLEMFGFTPRDERLRNLDSLTVEKLKELISELGLAPGNDKRKPALIAVLKAYAEADMTEAWVTVSQSVSKRFPQLLMFGGRIPDPDETVRAALNSRYQAHLRDEQLQGTISDLEQKLSNRLRADAETLCLHIKDRCPDLVDVSVEPEVSFTSGLRRTQLRLARAEGEPVGLESAGTGRSRRVALAVWEWTSELLNRETGTGSDGETSDPLVEVIVAYDEPDTHLDYAHQRRVMDLIRAQCAQPHTSVIVVTHSMNLIDGVDIGNLVHLRLVHDRTVMERLITDDHDGTTAHLNSIAAALGVRNSVLLHERCFVGVEGATEQQVFPLLFRLSYGMSLQSAGIALWACNDNQGALHFARFLVEHGRTVALVVDADSRTRPRSLFRDDRLRSNGLDPDTQVYFLGAPNELEELFLDEQWADAANELWQRNDGRAWVPADFSELRGDGKFSDSVVEMVKTASDTGPTGKPDALYGLATTLSGATDVPAALREVFDQLVEMASN